MTKFLSRLYGRPGILLIVILAVTAFFAIQLPNIGIDNDVMKFLPESDPARLDVLKSEDYFGGALSISVVIERKDGSILTDDGLACIQSLSDSLAQISGVDDITSLSTLDNIEGDAAGMVVTPLLVQTESGYDIPALKERLASWELYDKFIISDDESASQIIITMQTGMTPDEREDLYFSAKAKVHELLPDGYTSFIAGTPAITVLLTTNIKKDLLVLIPLVTILILLVLYLSFGHLGGVLIPVLTVLISTVWTMGLMSLLHVPLSILGTIMPVLLIAIGSAYGIHIINHYYDHMHEFNDESRKDLVLKVVKEVGLPVFLAGLTTLIGFGSFASSSVIPMRDFGIFTAIGVLSSIIVALLFIPSILLMKHSLLSGKGKGSAFARSVERFAGSLSRLVIGHPKTVLFFFAIILALAGYYSRNVVPDNTIITYFKEKTEIRQAEEAISRNFAGINSFDIVVSSDNPGGVLDPDLLSKLEKVRGWLTENSGHVTKVVGYTDFIKRINQALHAGEPGEFSAAAVAAVPSAAADDSTAGGSGSFFSGGDSSGTAGGSFFGGSGSDGQDAASTFFSSDAGTGSFFGDASGGEAAPAEPAKAIQAVSAVSDEAVLSAIFTAYGRVGANADLDAVLKELERMYNYKGFRFYEVPHDPAVYGLSGKDELKELISQYLLLFSGNLSTYSDDALEPQHIRMTVFLDSSSTLILRELRRGLDPYLESLFDGSSATYTVSGPAVAEEALSRRIIDSALFSILISVGLVCIVLWISYRSLRAGLIGSFAVGVTILVNYGIMGYSSIPLDISTALLGGMAIGIGVDYVIHFMNAYILGLKFNGTTAGALEYAFRTTAKPIIFNALSVAAGFSVLIFSNFNPLMYLGILTTVTMLVSSLCSLTLVPAIIYSFNIRFGVKPETNEHKSMEVES